MSDKIQFEELKETISKTKEKFDNYITLEKKQLEKLQNQTQEIPKTLQKKEEEITQQQNEIKEIQNQYLLKQKQMENETNRIEQKIKELEQKNQKKQDKFIQINQEIEQFQQQIDNQKKIIEQKKQNLDHFISKMNKEIELYTNYLGLEFERVQNDRLRFIFRKIDPKDHNKTFSFTVYIDQYSQYKVEECTPLVDNLKPLISNLNKTNDLSKFTKEIRKKFRILVSDF
ncbi:kinetochore protein spc25 [Anaeramoeba ignava]|uniref:Kinetochore protein SPC25 n=1 Tax=Anaeramoeba ignava TaxID=1746090 RepID=A0A9Q0LWB9_ANAIG|nr:kinetochore protein spc25 [Anaeramoeba ignava]